MAQLLVLRGGSRAEGSGFWVRYETLPFPRRCYRKRDKVRCSVVPDSSGTPWTAALQPLCPRDSPGKDTGVGGLALLQGIFPTQDRAWVSCTAGGFLTTESPGKLTDLSPLPLLQRVG